MFIKQTIRVAAATIILTLAIACAFSPESATPTDDHIDEKPKTLLLTGEDGKTFTQEDLERIRATANARSATNPARDKHDASEDQRWCQAWALDHLAPHVYAEFLQLDPEDMDDLDRSTWRKRLRAKKASDVFATLPESDPCWVYWSEPFNKANADKRNRKYEAECLRHVAQSADYQWASLAEAAVRYDDTTAYEIPNQYVRLLQWLHTPGRKLLKKDEPPHELLRRIALDPDAAAYARNSNIPERRELSRLTELNGPSVTEHWGLLTAVHTYGREACRHFYPQLFYGYWVPFTEPSDRPPQQLSEEELAQVEHLREGPLYLPKP